MQQGRKRWLFLGFLGLFALVFSTLWIAYKPELAKIAPAGTYTPVPEFTAWKITRAANGDQKKEKTNSKEVFKAWTIFHLWATWCEPCVDEFPVLLEMAGKYEKSSIRFVALSMDEKEDEVWKLVPKGQSVPTNWTMLWDESKGIPDQMGSFQYPETYLVSPQGEIRYKWVGPQKWLEPVHRTILEQMGALAPPSS